jgi:diadenosine tetraphosphatase ApaH/serine/threonine PP2A family protein phosphatase
MPILLKFPNIFEIKGVSSIKVTGDTHGHYDLKYILDNFGAPTIESQQLFLGDYVDRGKFAVQNLIILLLRKIIYPDTFHLLRGNHEDMNVCTSFAIYGNLCFSSQVEEIFKEYSEEACDMFFNIFSALPLACYGLDRFFVHAGIPLDNNSEIMSLDEINEQDRFYASIDQIKDKRWRTVVENLLWSDPGIKRTKNDRGGNTIVYGIADTRIFLKKYGLKEIFRAHEVVDGYRKDQESNNQSMCHTVFSASKYCGKKNMGGYVVCYADKTFDIIIYQTPIELMQNYDCDDNDISDANTPRTYTSINKSQ